MSLNESEYRVYWYVNSRTKRIPAREYVYSLDTKQRAKIFTYIELLKKYEGRLDEPYSRHIKGKIRELRVELSFNHHRIFYFTFVGKKIILLHAFLKKTRKTPKQEISRALVNYRDFIIYKKLKAYA